MLYLILTGAPGAGKGTQSVLLAAHYGLRHMSTGDLFRAHIEDKSPLGREARKYVDAGFLVPDSLVMRMVEATFKRPSHNTKGFLFDGFPRTIPQAEALDKVIAQHDGRKAHTLALHLAVPEKDLWRRILMRGQASGRADDQDKDKIRTRIEVYTRDTRPILDYYRKHHRLEEIQGVGEVHDIFLALQRVMDDFLERK